MCKMTIELNKDKINKDGIATYEEMMEAVDKICFDTFFHKTGHGEYVLDEKEEPVGAFLILISRFRQQLWLLPVMKVWHVVDDDGYEEDALDTYMRIHNNAVV